MLLFSLLAESIAACPIYFVRHFMKATRKSAARDINAHRQEMIRQEARKLVIEYWRRAQSRAGKPLTAFAVLPIEPRVIATDVLGLVFEEPYEIGSVPAPNWNRIDVAGQLNRAEKKIVVASRLPPQVKRFTGAHEIGHFVLHRGADNLRENPMTEAAIRSPFRPPREREADLFAAELLMPSKALEDAFSSLFGLPVDGNRIDEGQAFCLMGEKMTASELMRLAPIDRAKLIAEACSLTSKHNRSLADIFNVSSSAMGYQLLDTGLVS